MTGPALEIAALSSKKLEVLGAPQLDQVQSTGTAGTCFQYTKAGDRYVVCDDKEVAICNADCEGSPTLFSVDSPVTLLHFSSTGKYLVTHSRLPKEGYAKNLQVWDTEEGRMLTSFHKKGINADNWPAVQFNAEETHMFLLVKSAVAVYDMARDLTQESHKVKMDNITQYVLSPAPGKKAFASFVPEAKGNMPAVIACNAWGKGGSVTNRKQFFRAQRTNLLWNSKGTHVLGHTSCDFDATNQSYFGESRLYLLTADDRIDMQVTMESETMIVDCAWSPDGQFFVALGGISPSTAVLFDTKGKAVYQMATGPYNQDAYPDRGQSPERLKAVAEGKKQGKNLTVAPKAAGYVPPHLRGAVGQKKQAQVEGFDADEAAGRIRNMMANRGSKHVEGVESIMQTKNVNKNARKRANKAKKQVEGKSEGDNAEADAASDAVAAMSVQEVSAPAETAAPPAAAAAETAPQDPAKRLRNLRKKLVKVETAKEKKAKGDALTSEQKDSIDGEAALRKEMKSLGATDV